MTKHHLLAAMQRATVSGFGFLEQPLDEVSQELQLLTRHRRDLVEKRETFTSGWVTVPTEIRSTRTIGDIKNNAENYRSHRKVSSSADTSNRINVISP